jgi:DNA-directed RNA polymerase specialized sigma24 family protein
MNEKQFTEVYLPRYRDVIEALARKVARRDHELYEDLVQEGMILLLSLDPSKARHNEDAWIRQSLNNKMISVYRYERLRQTESLDVMSDSGVQVTRSDSGEPGIVNSVNRRRRGSNYDFDGESDE